MSVVLDACVAPQPLAHLTLADVSFVASLDTTVAASLARNHAPGAEIAAVADGRLVTAAGYGLADVVTHRRMTADTPIGVASVSKAVSSWGLLQLAASKALPLDSPITNLEHGWQPDTGKFDARAITPRRLLSHSAGVNMLSVPCFDRDSARPSLEAVLHGRAGDRGALQLTYAPGSQWSYSGGGYTLLQLAAEEQTRQPFSAMMDSLVLRPLGMGSSTFDFQSVKSRASQVYDEGGNPVRGTMCVGESAAGFFTTARDMGMLLVEYANAARGKSRLLSVETFALMTTPVIKADLTVDGQKVPTGDSQMALAHFVHATSKGPIIFHSGGNPGVAAYLLVDPARGNGIFIVVNSDFARPVIQDILNLWTKYSGSELPAFF
jgi:CubicO group peptidase (beta-lactamase class C family)